MESASPNAILCGGYSYLASWQALLWARTHNVPLLVWSESVLRDLRQGYPLVEFLKKEFYEMLDILGNVYSQDDFRQAKSNIKKLLTDMVASLKDRRVPIDDLSFNVMMGKSISGYKSAGGPESSKRVVPNQESLLQGSQGAGSAARGRRRMPVA